MAFSISIEKPGVILIDLPFCATCFFYFITFNILSLFFIFNILIFLYQRTLHSAFFAPMASLDPSKPTLTPIPRCQLPISWNNFSLEAPVTTPIRIRDEFSTRQDSHHTLPRTRKGNIIQEQNIHPEKKRQDSSF